MKEIARRTATVLAVLVVLPLASCATYRARPLHPKASARLLTARNLHDPRLLHFLAIEEHRAGSPRWNLETLTLVATYERPDMSIAAARLSEARADELTAAALPNPTLSFRPAYNTTTTIPSPWKVGPVVSFLIRSFGVRPALIARARARAAAAREAIAATAWRLRGKVRAALVSLWAAERADRLSVTALAIARRSRTVMTQRFKAGMVSAADLTMATLAEERAQFAAAASHRRLSLARTRLATTLEMPVAALDHVRLDLRGISRPQPAGRLGPLIHAALIRRPEVLAALARYRAAQATLRLQIARQYPSVDIGPGYRYDQGDNKFMLAVSLPLPILNQNQGPIARARAARRVAAAEFLATQARVLGQIERARADWKASNTELGSARRIRASAADVLARRRTESRAGEIGRLRLLGAENAFVKAEQKTLVASVHQREALGELESALYHPFLIAAGAR